MVIFWNLKYEIQPLHQCQMGLPVNIVDLVMTRLSSEEVMVDSVTLSKTYPGTSNIAHCIVTTTMDCYVPSTMPKP